MNITKASMIKILNGDADEIEIIKNQMGLIQSRCKYCGKTMLITHKGKQYCSPSCNSKMYRQRHEGYEREYKKMYARMTKGKISRDEFLKYMKVFKEREDD